MISMRNAPWPPSEDIIVDFILSEYAPKRGRGGF